MSVLNILTDLCYVCIKYFNSLCTITLKIKNIFANIVYNDLVLEEFSKQLAMPFKIDADFKWYVNRVRGSDRNNNTSYNEKY